jgi:hypothetical protein
MSDARWDDPREYGERDSDDERPRVYDERDRDEHDPRDGLMHDLDLPRGEERELVVDRDRVFDHRPGRAAVSQIERRRIAPRVTRALADREPARADRRCHGDDR